MGGLAMDRNWVRVVELLERALELARVREHPSTLGALAEEVVEECAYLRRPTPNDRLAFILAERAAGATFTAIARELGVSRQYVEQLVRGHKERTARVDAASRDLDPVTAESHIDRLDLPNRVRRALLERGVTTIAELLRLDQAAVLGLKRIGPVGWRRINSELARHHLGEPLPEHPALGSGGVGST